MSKYKDIKNRIRTLSEISSIMGSMKTLSLIETRKLARFLTNQQRIIQSIESVAADFLSFHPHMRQISELPIRLFIVIGSERGFCGDFNETLVTNLLLERKKHVVEQQLMIAVGQKLLNSLEEDIQATGFIEGPSVAEEIPKTLMRLLMKVNSLEEHYGPLSLNVIFHAEEKGPPNLLSLSPPFEQLHSPRTNFNSPPLINLTDTMFYQELVDYYLFTVLHGLFYASLMAEHQNRLRHLESAISNLDEETAELRLKKNALRQEEITEEIEVILLNKGQRRPGNYK